MSDPGVIESDKDRVTLTRDRYHELLVIEESMRRLDAGGVDNWEWYGESLNPSGEPAMQEFEDSL